MCLSGMWMTKSRSVRWLNRTEAQSGPPVTHQLAAHPQLECLMKTGTIKPNFTGNVAQMIPVLDLVNHILLKCESWSRATWKTSETECHACGDNTASVYSLWKISKFHNYSHSFILSLYIAVYLSFLKIVSLLYFYILMDCVKLPPHSTSQPLPGLWLTVSPSLQVNG